MFLLCFSVVASAYGPRHHLRRNPPPIGFQKLALYLGTGLFDPSVAEPRPGVTGCGGLFCDGEFFQEKIMNRTPEETEEIKNQAKEYFINQFGIDVDDPALEDRISFTMFMVNPDFEYRLHKLSHVNIPPQGWIIRDGGFQLSITDPNGIELGGELAGRLAPEGSAMFFGNYNILATNKRGRPVDEILIFYKSLDPGQTLANGAFVFRCNMFNEDWGVGLGLGTILFIPQEDGRIRGNGRNILSFPPVSTVENFPTRPAFDDKPRYRRPRY
jgi:hypothetical protein